MVTPTKASSRSSFIFKTPLPTNDDDDERRRSRAVSVASSTGSVNGSVLEENEELKVCLQQFMDNKINKENAWNTNLIDTLANLVSGHRKYVKNFQVVGASLEASSKIYGYRVDMVHTEVMRMSGGLTRMNVGGKNDNDENDNSIGAANDDSITETGNDLQDKQSKAKAKAKKRRQQSSTVTKCKATINGKLDTIPFLDPVFADIKSNLGDMNSSNRAFLNTLKSCNSELLFDYDKPYWDGTPNDFVMKEDDSPAAIDNKFYFMKYKKMDGPVKIRTIFREYNISDKPCDMNKIMQSTVGDNNINIDDSDSENGHMPENNPDIDDPSDVPVMTFAFDANAEIEPVQETRTSCQIEVDPNEFSTAEIAALNTVAGAKRTHILIDTLQPCDASRRKLEYSYRPLTEITKFWAGPSYWKIRPSVPKRTEAQQQQRRTSDGTKPIRHVAIKRKPKKMFTTEVEDPDLSLFKVLDPNRKPINIMKNWEPKKLKLPLNHHIDDEYFDKLSYAQGMKLKTSMVITSLLDVNKKADTQEEIPNELDMNEEVCGGDTNFQNENLEDEEEHPNENLNLSTLLAKKHLSPQKIEKIIIPYATKAKIINMKQLKLSCSKVVNEPSREQATRQLNDVDVTYLKKVTRHLKDSNESYDKGYATFYELYNVLPAHLSDVLKDNLSVPIAFSAILHLANERNFRFVPTDAKQRDFKIIKVLPK